MLRPESPRGEAFRAPPATAFPGRRPGARALIWRNFGANFSILPCSARSLHRTYRGSGQSIWVSYAAGQHRRRMASRALFERPARYRVGPEHQSVGHDEAPSRTSRATLPPVLRFAVMRERTDRNSAAARRASFTLFVRASIGIGDAIVSHDSLTRHAEPSLMRALGTDAQTG